MGLASIKTTTKSGHGLDSKNYSGDSNNGDDVDITRRKYAPDMVAPNHHYGHPYKEEIDSLEYRPWQLDVSGIDSNDDEKIAEQSKYKNKAISSSCVVWAFSGIVIFRHYTSVATS